MANLAVVMANVMAMKQQNPALKIVKTKANVKKPGMVMPAAWMPTVFM